MVSRPRHVLITGGSRGIGLSIAQLFAKSSYRCTLISRSEESLKTAVSTLHPLQVPPLSSKSSSTTESYQHGYIPGDITHVTQFWATQGTFGTHLPLRSESSKIDVLVNCAGKSQSGLFLKTPDTESTDILNVNLTALMDGTRFLLRKGYLRGDKTIASSDEKKNEHSFSPVVINIASLLGLSGGYGAVAYAASKAGVLGFTRALATEYVSHRVRVNAVVPGYIETEMTEGLNKEELRQRIPLGRFGKADEVAQAVLFLAENGYAHNCVVNLDGGLSAV